MELGEKHLQDTLMLVVHMRVGNRGGTKRFDFRCDPNAIDVNYIGKVTYGDIRHGLILDAIKMQLILIT